MEEIHTHFFKFLFLNLFIFTVKLLSGHHRDLKTVPVIESCPLHGGSWVLRCHGIGIGRRQRLKTTYQRIHVYTIIWKPQIREYFQCVKQPTKEVDKNVTAVVRTNYCKEKIVGHVQHNISMIISMFFSLPTALH